MAIVPVQQPKRYSDEEIGEVLNQLASEGNATLFGFPDPRRFGDWMIKSKEMQVHHYLTMELAFLKPRRIGEPPI